MNINERLSVALTRLDNMTDEGFMEDLIKFGYTPPATKIIFLDIDGVLNNASDSDMHCHMGGCDFYSNTCVQRLNTIIQETGAKICVSSTWRLGLTVEEIAHKLKGMGVVGDIVGVTDNLRHHHCLRGNEIHNWIQDNKNIIGYDYYSDYKSYVILDDDSDMLLWQKDNFVHTNGEVGLCDADVEKAIMILNRGGSK